MKRNQILLTVLLSVVASLGWGDNNGLGSTLGIQTEVTFLNPSGHTSTNASGIHYNLWDWYMLNETLFYSPKTWGQLYPLYFLGQTVNFTVRLTNVAPGKKTYRMRIVGTANDLRPPF